MFTVPITAYLIHLAWAVGAVAACMGFTMLMMKGEE